MLSMFYFISFLDYHSIVISDMIIVTVIVFLILFTLTHIWYCFLF